MLMVMTMRARKNYYDKARKKIRKFCIFSNVAVVLMMDRMISMMMMTLIMMMR